jgi:segregation and condensation protein B
MTDKIIENTENNEGMRDGAWDAAAVEAILFASGCPVTYEKIGEALSMTELEARDFVKSLLPRYEGRGIELIAYPDSCVLCSRAEYEEKIKLALGLRRSGTLSNSALETLAVIVRNQPATRSYIEQVRGVDSSYSVGVLCDRGLIEPVGRLDVPGKPVLYATTEAFLRCFGLNSLDEIGSLGNIAANEEGEQSEKSETVENIESAENTEQAE